MTSFGWIRHRELAVIATASFDPDLFRDLPQVVEEVELITAWLTDEKLGRRCFTHVYDELAKDPSCAQIEDRFRNPPRDMRWNDATAAVLYITGHGVVHEGRHYLVLSETEGSRLDATAFDTDRLLRWLNNTDLEHLLVLIDVCSAGQAAKEMVGWPKRPKDNWLVLPSALADQTAEPGALTRAISTFLSTAAEFNTHAQYLTVGLFVDAINEQLPPGQKVERIYKGRLPDRGKDRDQDRERHVCLPNPAYEPRDELVSTDPALQALALRKQLLSLHNRVSRGMPSADSPGWLFTGRERLMRDLISAARTPVVTMITGSAGSGKSTALSRLVTMSDRDFRVRDAAELAGVPADLVPMPGIVDVALSARSKSSRQVVTQICFDLGILAHAGSWDDPVRANLEALSEYLAARQAPVTIVIDALDEALDAVGLVTDVLKPLKGDHPDRLCLLVGVRSSGGDSATAGARGEPREEPLRDMMVAELAARELPADDDLRWNPHDLTTFVRNVLTNTENSPYRDAGRATVDAVADVISSLSGRSYLMAGAAAKTITDRPEVAAPDDPALLSDLKGGLHRVFRRDLQESLSSPRDRRRAVALLRALAFAHGTGLPRRLVWPNVATAVDAGDDEDMQYGDGEIRSLLQSRLSAYLRTDQQDDLTVYRLMHDELREILQYRWRELLEPIPLASEEVGPPNPDEARADEAEIRAVEARIADKLDGLARVKPTVFADQVVPPYIRRHLAEHALDGDVLDECVEVPFLPYLDLARLRAAVGASPDRRELEETIPWLPVMWQVAHLWDWNRPAHNAAAIAMWAELNEHDLLGSVKERGPAGGPWRVDWAVQPPDMGNVLGRHDEEVLAAATAELSGAPVAVTGGEDGLLHVWDLSTGAHYLDREPIETSVDDDEKKTIWSVAAARLPDGRTVAVTGGANGSVRVWDLQSGRAVGEPLVSGGEKITAVMTATLTDQRVVLTAADEAGTVRTWDLASGEPVGTTLRCGPGLALGLATAQIGERVLGLATGEDSGLQLWDLATGRPTSERLTGHPLAEQPGTGRVQGGQVVASAVLTGQDVGFTGNGDGLLRWDLRERTPIGRLRGGDGPIRSLAVTHLDSRVMAMTGGNRTVQVWDLAVSEQVGELLTGHDGSVEAIAMAGSVGGSVLAVSASRDKSVRIWDVPDAALARRLQSQQIGIVEAVATAWSSGGQAVALTCTDTAVQVWDLEHGGEPEQLTGHDSPVVSVTAAQLPDGLLAVAGHWDGWISAWRVTAGPSARSAEIGDLGAAASLATATLGDGRPVILAGGWDGEIRLWDPLAGTSAGESLRGHAGIIVAVCTATLAEDRTLVISGSRDGDVRVRDLSAHLDSGRSALDAVDADTGEEVASLAVAMLAGGRPCVVVGGEDGRVRLLDLLDGTPVREWPACSGPVAAVAAGQLADGRVVVFTGGEASLVQAWDAGTGEPVGEALPVPGPVRAMAFQTELSSLVVGGTGVAAAHLHSGTR
jgi:WD40 repeat protein